MCSDTRLNQVREEIAACTNLRMKTKLSILHLEDDRHDPEIIASELTKAGWAASLQVVTPRNEYLAALEAGAFDVILSDHKLPGFDPDQAVRLAREKFPHVPFIFVSGLADGGDGREKLLAAGATA